MGGYGVWQEIVDHPGVFAAAVAVSGGLTPSADMDNLFVSVKGDDPFVAVAAAHEGIADLDLSRREGRRRADDAGAEARESDARCGHAT